jgi:YVTN family beta-propeller protein
MARRIGTACVLAVLLLAFAASGAVARNVYVANTGLGTLSVIDSASNGVFSPSFPAGITPINVALTPDGKTAYVADRNQTSRRWSIRRLIR